MNTLATDKKLTALAAILEGNSIRSVVRMTGIHRDTIMRLVTRTGEGCCTFLDREVRNVSARRVQADEIWTYVFKKQARIVQGDSGDFGDHEIRTLSNCAARKQRLTQGMKASVRRTASGFFTPLFCVQNDSPAMTVPTVNPV